VGGRIRGCQGIVNIDAYCVLGVDREYDLTEARLLRAMDAAGVDRAVVAPLDRCLAVDNREGNDHMLAAAQAHPDRLIPACSVNPWYGARAIQELKRGYQANDELVWPLLDALEGKRTPVYVHTGTPGNATPWQLVDLAERYPATDFIMGHCGATDFWNDVRPAAAACANLYLEASLARPFVFAGHVRELGDGRGIMGSFAPLNDLAFEWEEMRRVLPPAQWPGVYGGNIARLLGEDAAA